MNVLSIAKLAASTVVGLGAGKIVGSIIKAHATPETLVDKITMVGGAWAIAGMVSKASKRYTDEAIDQVAGVVGQQVDKMRESNKLARIDRKESTFEKEGLNPENYIQHPKSKIWINLKTYRKTQLMKVNAGQLKLADAGIEESSITQDKNGKWHLIEDDQPETITLIKNGSGVWEEISLRGKS